MNAPSQKLHLLPGYREDPIAPHVAAMLGHLGEDPGTTTRALRGVYAHDALARRDVLSMIKGS